MKYVYIKYESVSPTRCFAKSIKSAIKDGPQSF